MTSQDSIEGMVKGVVDVAGGIGILVNNAGFFDLGPLFEITSERYEKVFAVNVKGLLFTLQAVAAQMVQQGRGGKIINMSSQAGRRVEALATIYCASKAAVISITQSAGLELIRNKINVNGIAPGVVDTPMWDKVDALFAKYEHRQSARRNAWWVRPCRSAAWELRRITSERRYFLASSDSDYVVAQTLNVDGGNWMS